MSTTFGSARDPNIKRRTLTCSTHGSTEHAQYLTGKGSTAHWYCMTCRREQSREAQERKRQVATAHTVVLEPAAPRSCKRCYVELGSSEDVEAEKPVCDECAGR